MDKQKIDTCYIIGTCLLYKKSVDRVLLNIIEKELSNDYEVDLSDEKVMSAVIEWKDFFTFDIKGNIILTKEIKNSKYLVKCLFTDVLDLDIYNKLLEIIFNVTEKTYTKTKVINFFK